MSNSNYLKILTIVAILIGVSAGPAVAGPQQGDEALIAAEQLHGTNLTVLPKIAYEAATLRVTGPNGYAVTKDIVAGDLLSVDLFADAGLRSEMQKGEGEPAKQTPGVSPQATWSTLPEGSYRYEVVFTDVAGKRRVHTGVFYMEGGALVSSEAMRSRRAPDGSAIPGSGRSHESMPVKDPMKVASDVIPKTTNADDVVQIYDTAEDGVTHIFMESGATTPPSNWHIRNEQGDMRFREYLGSGVLFDRMTLEGQNLGLGTTAPATDFHIAKNGVSKIFMEDTGSGDADWAIWNQNPFGLLISTGTASTIAPVIFQMSPTGNVIIKGDVALGSSREIKHDMGVVADHDVLATLQKLSIHRWKYRDDPEQARHVGPMAEDFHRLFGLGADDKHLSPTDTSGVALAAVKALQAQIAILVRENAETNQELETIRAELASLRNVDAALGIEGQ